MATFEKVPALGWQVESSTEVNATKTPQTSQWNGMNKSLSAAGMALPNQASRPRRVRHHTRPRGHKFLPPVYASILKAAGVFIVLMLIHQCALRYTKCLRSLSRATVGDTPKASSPTRTSSHIPRRLAAYTGEIDGIVEHGSEVVVTESHRGACRRYVVDMFSQAHLQAHSPPHTQDVGNIVGPLQVFLGVLRVANISKIVWATKRFLQVLMALLLICTMTLVFAGEADTVSAATDEVKTNSSVTTPQQGQCYCAIPTTAKVLVGLLAGICIVNETATILLQQLGRPAEGRNRAQRFIDATASDVVYAHDDVEGFLAPKGPSRRRQFAGLQSSEEEVDYLVDDGDWASKERRFDGTESPEDAFTYTTEMGT